MPKKNNGPQLALNNAGIYEIRWTEARRSNRKSTGTADIIQAQAALGRHLLGLFEEKKVSVSNVAAVLEAYDEEHVQQRVVATERQEGCIAILKAGLGHLDVQQLTPAAVLDYCKDRRAGKVNDRKVGNGTLRRELNCLIAAINHAARHRRIPRADVPHVALPDAPPPRDLWLTEAQLNVFIDKAAALYAGERLSRLHRFVVLAAETAARKTSILTLRWHQVDLKARLIHFQNDGNQRTKKRRVPVPMSDVVFDVMTRAWAERTQDEWVLDTPYSIQHHFDALVMAAGKGFEGVTPHTLRHTWATHAARAGVPLFEIAGVLGDTLQTVMRVYAHHCPDHLRGAVNFRARPARNADNPQPTPASQVLVFPVGRVG
jgi:integrase